MIMAVLPVTETVAVSLAATATTGTEVTPAATTIRSPVVAARPFTEKVARSALLDCATRAVNE